MHYIPDKNIDVLHNNHFICRLACCHINKSVDQGLGKQCSEAWWETDKNSNEMKFDRNVRKFGSCKQTNIWRKSVFIHD